MSEGLSHFKVFFSLMDDLKSYREHLVIVGGWLPWLYKEFLWKQSKYLPVRTMDIDIGIKEFYHFDGEKVSDHLLKQHYEARAVYSEEATPFQLFIKSENLDYPIDFIMGEYASPDIIQRVAGKDLYVLPIEYFDFLLKKTMTLSCRYGNWVYRINIPLPASYFFHKAVTFPGRGEEGHKWKKDLYYLFYILDNLPSDDEDSFIKKIISYRSEGEFFELFLKNIEEYFHSAESLGPKCIVDFFFNPGPLFRKYILETFREFIEKVKAGEKE